MKPLKKLRVLIAEDALVSASVIQSMLVNSGHTVVGLAQNGRQAFAMTQTLQPDIVLMDIEMPEMDGLEATQMIQEECPRPVVLLTCHLEPELVARASQVGVGAYLAKPPEAPELDRAMAIAAARFADLMELRRLNHDLQQALAEIKTLRGIIPICSHCMQIRDEQGAWQPIEAYVRKHSEADFSHGICPQCAEKHFGVFFEHRHREHGGKNKV